MDESSLMTPKSLYFGERIKYRFVTSYLIGLTFWYDVQY